MSQALCRAWVLAVLVFGSFAGLSRAESPAAEEFDARIEAELRAADPRAADIFAEANRAREADPARAESLFREVLELQPGYFHATRRLCNAVLQQGRRDEALGLCRQAMAAKDTLENRAMLITALVHSDDGTRPAPGDASEAASLAEALLVSPGVYPELVPSVCSAAIASENLALLERCVIRLERDMPQEVLTHYYAWLHAVSVGEYRRALASLERARELGLPPDVYARLRDSTVDQRPWISRNARVLGLTGAVWVGGLLLLLVLGMVLSRLALEASRRTASVNTGESVGLGGALRRTYQAVLWLSCVYYYVSIPLVLAIVLAVGGGIIYAFFALGRIPLKLVAIVAGLTLITVWAALKSFFVRSKDEDPGERLALADHPRMRAVLDEVAREIGTRPVDNVYMTPGTDLAVMERGGILRQIRGATERCLILGAGVLEGMKLGPFKAILAHEYGHFSNRDTAGGGFALAVRRSMATMAMQLVQGGAAAWYNPAWIFLNGFNRIFLRISQGASRLQEVLADRWASFAYGARAFERGLRHVIERSVRFDLHAQSTLRDVIENAKPLVNFYTFASTIPIDELKIVDAVSQAINAQPSPYDSHPSPQTRFELVHGLNAGASGNLADAEEDAWSLFTDPAAIQLAMTERIRENVAQQHGIRIATA